MKKKILGVSKPAWMGALAIGLLTPLALWAVVNVNTASIFEIDGGALSTTNDDWDDFVPGGINGSTARTGILSDPTSPATDRIFTGGGSKDERDVSGGGQTWQHTLGSVPDKNNLTHAFAAAYQGANTDGDLLIYFGADRFDNSGDSAIGFWFFQDNVGIGPNGTFTGQHRVGDVLVTSDFRNGGGVSIINVFKWVGGSAKIQLIASGQAPGGGGTTTPFCLTNGANPAKNIACAISNRAVETPPVGWPNGFLDKSGFSTWQISEFFEGGINISQLLGTNTTCFSSFLAMTRSSASTTAQLKDFVSGAFPLCGVGVAKVCNGTTTVVGSKFHTEYTVTVSNIGGGPLFDAAFIEETGKLSTAGYACSLTAINGSAIPAVNIEDGDEVRLVANLASGGTATGKVECNTPENGFENTASSIAYVVDSDGNPNAQSVTSDEPASDDCPLFQFSNALTIQKDCASPVTVTQGSGGVLTPNVCVNITVTNQRNEPVNNIQVLDNKIPNDATVFPAFNLSAAGGTTTSKTFSNKCYTPSAADDPNATSPGDIAYTDTAQASGTGTLSAATVSSTTDSATCPLCPCTNCN
jgi:hypothetical protein